MMQWLAMRGEASYRALFEAAPNGIMVVDSAGSICMVNGLVEKMFACSRDELVGRSVEELLPERLRAGHAELRLHFSAAPQMRRMGSGRHLRAVRKDGTEFSVEVGLSPVLGAAGTVVVTIVDIADREQSADRDKLLERARAKLKMCDQLGMPAAVLQREGRIVLSNTTLETLRSQFVVGNDQIRFPNEAANRRFTNVLSCLGRDQYDDSVRWIPVPATVDRPPLLFYFVPMSSPLRHRLGILVATPLVAAHCPSPDLVQSLFGLTRAESRVAALVGSGVSPRQTAERLGISAENARTTLKHVFGKVGVVRQSELVALVRKLGFPDLPQA